MSKGEKPILSVRVDHQLLERVDALCERAGVGRAEIIERCIMVGLADEEEFVEWLESPVKGEVIHMLTHPRLIKFIASLIGDDRGLDETQLKVRRNIKSKKQSRGKSLPTTG